MKSPRSVEAGSRILSNIIRHRTPDPLALTLTPGKVPGSLSCSYLDGYCTCEVIEGGEGPEAGERYIAYDCRFDDEENEIGCLYPGEPCPAKGPYQIEKEWLAAFNKRMNEAHRFIRSSFFHALVKSEAE
jgi:hypothetical protein